MKIIVNTSTLKQDKDDMSPEFVNNLVEGFASRNENNQYIYLYPMKKSLPKKKVINNITYIPYRYWFTKRGQNIAEIGILQSLRVSKLNYIKVLFLIISQFLNLLYFTIKLRPNYVYSHWVLPQGLISAILSKITKTKYVVTSHGSDVTLLRKYNRIGKYILTFVIKNATKISVVSKKNYEKISELVPLKPYDYKIKIIPMGIDNIFLNNIENDATSEKFNFLYYGRLTEYKGVELLINAFKIISEKNTEILLTIIGKGDQYSFLSNLVSELNLDESIKIRPFQDKSELIKYIDKSELVIVPSLETKYEFEAGPLTIIESMARKRICLVSDSVGFMSYIDNSSALIFESGSLTALVSSLEKFLKMENKERKNIITNSLKIVDYFNYGNISKIHSDFLFDN